MAADPFPTRREVTDAISVLAARRPQVEQPEPLRLADLRSCPGVLHDLIHERARTGCAIGGASTFRWPKEHPTEYRQMAWLEVPDRVVLHCLTGRVVRAIESGLDRERVFSGDVQLRKWGWEPLPFWRGDRARSDRRQSLLRSPTFDGYLSLDIRNCYPSVETSVVREALLHSGAGERDADRLTTWLRDLRETWGIHGLPTGHDPGRVIANCVLSTVDGGLYDEHTDWLRYVDDYWIFARTESAATAIEQRLRTELLKLGLELNDSKRRWNESSPTASRLGPGSYDSDDAGWEDDSADAAAALVASTMAEPYGSGRAVRRAIRSLARANDPRGLPVLLGSPAMLRVAPQQSAEYIHSMWPHHRTDPWRDEILAAALATPTLDSGEHMSADDVIRRMVFLQGLMGHQVPKSVRAALERLLTGMTPVPIKVSAAGVWNSAEGWKAGRTADLIFATAEPSARRVLLGGVHNHRAQVRPPMAEKLRRTQGDLGPTLSWALAA